MLVLDSSALVKRYVEEDGTKEVLAIMASDSVWAASALALVETRIVICRALEPGDLSEALSALEADWQRFHVVPLDEECLERAARLGCEHGLRALDALHLAAADRLPRPLRFLTFDARQAAVAAGLGLSVADTGRPA